MLGALNFIDALLEPVGVILVAGEQAEGRKRSPRLGFVGGEFFQRATFEGTLEAEGERVPLFLRGKLELLFEFGRRELVEEIFPQLKKFVSRRVRRRWLGRRGLRGERQDQEAREGGLKAAVHVTARNSTRLGPRL